MKKLSLKDPQTKILLITLGVILATYTLGQEFIIKPYKNKITKLRAQLEHIKLEDEVAKICNEVNRCEKCLPPQKDASWLLSEITGVAKEAKIDIESVEPLPLKQFPPYSYVPFKIKTTCTFSKLVRFIDLLESSPYILSIESLKLESQGKYIPELPKEEMDKEVLASIEMVIGTIY